MKHQRGISLIELVIFIVVMGILGLGILMSFGVALEKTLSLERKATALALAQSRMEIILGQREMKGFGYFTDICDPALGTPPAVCEPLPTGFSIVTPTVTTTLPYKTITIEVTGEGYSSLLSEVAGY